MNSDRYTIGDRALFSSAVQNGDSGHPVMLLIDNRPILLGTTYISDMPA